jgi:transposase-like protein
VSGTDLNKQLSAAFEAQTGKRYCRACSQPRQSEGGSQRGRAPWKCARCTEHTRAGPMARRKPNARGA